MLYSASLSAHTYLRGHVLHEALHLQIAHQQAGAELEEPEQQASRDYSNKEAEREHHAANELQAKGSSSRCTLRCDTMS